MRKLQVKTTLLPSSFNLTVSLFCNVGNMYFPLLVEEGSLFVEENGIKYFLCVDKK